VDAGGGAQGQGTRPRPVPPPRPARQDRPGRRHPAHGHDRAVRRGWAGRTDLDALLDRSGVVGGTASELAKQAEALERYLRLEPGAYVFHKTGWGIGKIVDYSPEKGKCTIDFLTKRGHLMDLLAAADLLERLRDDDLLVMKAYKKDQLAKEAAEKPIEVLRHVLVKLGGDAPLRHVRTC
jgi:transcription elongation factor GreA-like protein